MRWLARAFVAAVAIFAASCTTADEGVASERCSERTAQHVVMRDLVANAATYMGRCVTTEGIVRYVTMFADADAIYEEPTDSLNPSSNGGRLGVDNLDITDDFRLVSVTGRLQDCQSISEAAEASAGPDEIVMITGFCHSWEGPFIWTSRVRPIEGRLSTRRLQDSMRPGYGDLRPAPEGWPHEARVRALMREYLAALRSNDQEAFLALHFPEAERRRAQEARGLSSFVFDPSSPFANLPSGAEPHIFVYANPYFEPSPEDADDYSATICICREKSCEGRWPIASIDADNAPSRPYVCTTVGPYLVYREGTRPAFDTPIRQTGLPEPH